jgi:hypothetical protein
MLRCHFLNRRADFVNTRRSAVCLELFVIGGLLQVQSSAAVQGSPLTTGDPVELKLEFGTRPLAFSQDSGRGLLPTPNIPKGVSVRNL